VPSLENGSYATAASAASAPGHVRIRQRVDLLLTMNGFNPATLPSDYLTTERVSAAGAGLSADQVHVILKVPFVTFFPLLKDVLPQLSSDVSAPYLFV
jgi:hypothetical protein